MGPGALWVPRRAGRWVPQAALQERLQKGAQQAWAAEGAPHLAHQPL